MKLVKKTKPLNPNRFKGFRSGASQNRTGDTRIFSPVRIELNSQKTIKLTK